jgi:hypothetical protein
MSSIVTQSITDLYLEKCNLMKTSLQSLQNKYQLNTTLRQQWTQEFIESMDYVLSESLNPLIDVSVVDSCLQFVCPLMANHNQLSLRRAVTEKVCLFFGRCLTEIVADNSLNRYDRLQRRAMFMSSALKNSVIDKHTIALVESVVKQLSQYSADVHFMRVEDFDNIYYILIAFQCILSHWVTKEPIHLIGDRSHSHWIYDTINESDVLCLIHRLNDNYRRLQTVISPLSQSFPPLSHQLYEIQLSFRQLMHRSINSFMYFFSQYNK